MARRSSAGSRSEREPVEIDSNVAHASRIYDFLLGGSDNFPVDRETARYAFDAYPGGVAGVRSDARGNRAFLGRAVRYMANTAGIRQFLDIGTGIPSVDPTHQVAQVADPTSRIVYVDNDPIVLAHAHTLLRREAATRFVDGDFLQPEHILEEAERTLDLSEPIGLVLVGITHVIPDEQQPREVIATLVKALSSGSHMALSQLASDVQPDQMTKVQKRLETALRDSNPPQFRSKAEIEAFFDGLEMVEPGVVRLVDWHPDEETEIPTDRPVPVYCGVGRKP